MAKKSGTSTHRVARDSRSGRFTSINNARKNPATTVIERVPNPGHGQSRSKGPRTASGTDSTGPRKRK